MDIIDNIFIIVVPNKSQYRLDIGKIPADIELIFTSNTATMRTRVIAMLNEFYI